MFDRLITRLCMTLFITFMYRAVWIWISQLIDGCIVNRTVDNIMMVLFMPIIFIATDVLTK